MIEIKEKFIRKVNMLYRVYLSSFFCDTNRLTIE